MLSQSQVLWSFHYIQRESDITINSLSKYLRELAGFVCFLQFLQKDYFQIGVYHLLILKLKKLLLFQIIQEYWQVLPDCYFARYVDMVTNWALLQSLTFSSSPP